MLTWREDDRFVLGDTRFRAMQPDALTEGSRLRRGEFYLFKPPSLVDQYVALLEALEPQQILELGIFGGGSTLFFAEFSRPQRVVAIDREPLPRVRGRVDAQAGRSGLAEVVRTYGEVDQADRSRLAEIVDEEFDDPQLDLVVDDCSHLYEPTRASFNELFPRLRPGGVYVIEDWRWAHPELESEHPEGFFPDEVPLTRLLFEIALAIPGIPGLVAEIAISMDAVVVTRGDATVDPATFDVSASSNRRGQALLAPA